MNARRMFAITMNAGWSGRLREACRLIAMPVEELVVGTTTVTAYVTTRRSRDEVEREVRAQLMFPGWMLVEEEEDDDYSDFDD